MKALTKFARRHTKAMVAALDDYRRYREGESLHRVRIEIKKIKALLNVMEYGIRGFKAHRHFLPFRNIFRKAGAIREPEVMLALALRYEIRGIGFDRTSGKDRKLVENFRNDIAFFQESASENGKKILKKLAKLPKRKFRKYLDEKHVEIKSALYPKLRVKDLHHTRKIIKEVVSLSGAEDSLKKKYRKFLTVVELVIGKMNDKRVLVTFLREERVPVDEFVMDSLEKAALKDMKSVALLARHFYGE